MFEISAIRSMVSVISPRPVSRSTFGNGYKKHLVAAESFGNGAGVKQSVLFVTRMHDWRVPWRNVRIGSKADDKRADYRFS
jgi:hypothetical protein